MPNPSPNPSRFLLKLLSTPTAPYCEGKVMRLLSAELKRAKIPHFLDPIGNLVVGAADKKEYFSKISSAAARSNKREPLRFFVAHADHPGFHLERWVGPDRFQFKWFGGSPQKHIVGARVWVSADGTERVESGTIVNAKMDKSGRFIASGTVRVSRAGANALKEIGTKSSPVYGGLGFRAPVWRSGDELYTKAADDLVGAYMIVSAAKAAWKKPKLRGRFLAIISRAEEIGFMGCIGHLALGWLQKSKRQVLGVSLEASRAMPGAEFGKGPVVRIGDRRTIFDPKGTEWLQSVAEKKLKKRFQKKLMEGGTCEGTVLNAYGLQTIAITTPLGNYHNQDFQGGPDSRGKDGPAPEFVHLADLEGYEKLCHALVSEAFTPEKFAPVFRKKLRQSYKKEGAPLLSRISMDS